MASQPARIGKYTVEGVLGRGGMGVVYKAVDSQIGRYVAIKMITSGGDPSLLERFRSEARSTGSLQHPNIVTVYDFGEQDGNPYLVMQFLEGSSLEALIQKGTSLSLSERLGILIDVCNGLAYAHQRGVIHRDIKPGNVIVLQDGVNDGMGMIVDFGIARIGGDTRLTKTDQIVGSVHYMSPEQLQAKELDARTDIYAAGVVLFQLLTGALPFDAPDTAATLLQIVNEPPPPLSKYLKEYPPELDAIVKRALAKNREERYPTAKDFAFDLGQVQERVKFETVAKLVVRAEASLNREEWTRARECLQQVLRIDRQNTQAQKMMSEVQERLRQQQQIEQARGLRSQADEAFMDQHYDDALRLLDQAVALDSKNNDLLTFRDSVRAERERATGLRRALRRAEVALRDGDLDEAQSAVDEAFKIDPHDTQAKALKVIISQHAEERVRQDELRTLLDQARNQIAARNLTEAFATLKTAETLDPGSNELRTVVKMAVSAREQEKRRLETDELRRQVETALVHEDYATAVSKAEEGLRRYPQEQSLLKLKELAEEQRERVEHKRYVREQFAAASSLADSGELTGALAILENALQRAPGNSELETLLATVHDGLAEEGSKNQRIHAVDHALYEGKRILQEQGARKAREFLDSQIGQYPESPQLRELHNAARAREALDDLDGRLAVETNPARRVQLAELAVRSNPENPWLRQRLADLQKVRSQITAAIDRAQDFETSGRLSDALHEWQQLKASYPRVPEFEAQVSRLLSLQGEGKKPGKAPQTVSPPALPQTPKASQREEILSATRVLGTAPPGNVVGPEGVATRVLPQPAGAPVVRKVATTSSDKKLPWKFPQVNVQALAKNLVAGPYRYFVLAAAMVVLVSGVYLIVRGHTKKSGAAAQSSVSIPITTNPPDAVVTVDSKPLPNRTVMLPPGGSVTIEVTRVGYKSKRVEVRKDADAKIQLEPEPLRLSVQTPEKSGTVELDGQKISDLSDGNMDGYDLVPDGNAHKLSVTVRGSPLFVVELRAIPGSLPQVSFFEAKDLFLITSLDKNAKIFAGRLLKNVRLGEQHIEASSSGADLNLAESNNEIKFGEGNDQGSLTLDISNAPTLAVHSTNVDGQVQVTSNVDEATLAVDGTVVKRQRHGWSVSRSPGAHNFVLSAEGYEPQTWTMTLQRRQSFAKKIDLKTKMVSVSLVALVVAGGTPGAEVVVDGQRVGELDGSGNLHVPNLLRVGPHSIAITKPYHEGRTVEVTAKLPELRIDEPKLTPWPTVSFQTAVSKVMVKYQRVGDSQEHQSDASAKIRLPSGQYSFTSEATGFQKFATEIKLGPGEDVTIPLKLVPIPDFEFQDATQVIHDGSWIKAKDPHRFVYLKAGLLHENLVFAKPGKTLFWNKKVEWVIEIPEGSVRLQYALEGQKIVRKLVVKEESSDQKEAKVDAAAAEATSISIHIQVDGAHVVISNDKGTVLDEYTASQHNFSTARIGIRTESQFVAREK